jgi:hypothetical protein
VVMVVCTHARTLIVNIYIPTLSLLPHSRVLRCKTRETVYVIVVQARSKKRVRPMWRSLPLRIQRVAAILQCAVESQCGIVDSCVRVANSSAMLGSLY